MGRDLTKIKKQNVVEIPIPGQEEGAPKKKTPAEKKQERIEKVENKPDVSDGLSKIKRDDINELIKVTKGLDNVEGLLKLMKADNELLEIISDASIKFANQVAKQRTLRSRDIEALNKLSNTALKRQALIAAAIADEGKEPEEKKGIDIKLTI